MNTQKNIKLIRLGDIRKLHKVPITLQELRNEMKLLFSDDGFTLSYGSDQQINTDSDLLRAYEVTAALPSLKIYLQKSSATHPICHSCKSSLTSPVYQCLECLFYLCNNCETKNPHPHLLIKSPSLQAILTSPYCPMHPKKIMHQLYRLEKKMIKVKVLSHLLQKGYQAVSGSTLRAGWILENSGKIDWPEGTVLFWRSGELKSKNVIIDPLKIGESCEVAVEVLCPLTAGDAGGCWELIVRGICVAKLKARVTVI